MSIKNINLLVISGTGREGNFTDLACDFVCQKAQEFPQFSVSKVKVADFSGLVTGQSDNKKDWNDKIAEADAVVIVSPEYNRGYPGELKLALDLTKIDNSLRKPVGLVGVSSGGFGGSRVLEQLKLVSIELGLLPVRTTANFSHVGKDLWPDHSKDHPVPENIEKATTKMLSEVLWLALALKSYKESSN